tara:strand:- start:387 stop:1493 length:1107 start_codon:yes stop_codon:yes gene_type:complete
MSNARKLADNLPTDGQLGNRNLIINGAQNVHQRGNQTGKTASVYGTDRFEAIISGRSELVYNLAQNTDVPSGYGFAHSLSFQTTTPESSIGAAEYYFISQKIEAQNLQHLAYGTSGAKKLTASFWVKSSVTGTFCLGLFKDDSAGSLEYQVHNKTYTISAANTWEHKTITFEANTLTGGSIADDNGIGLYLSWHLAAGSNYDSVSTSSGWANYTTTNWCEPSTTDAVITTTNATFLLTGVQLEVGPQATPFEHESYDVTLEKCQRYYQKSGDGRTYGVVFNQHTATNAYSCMRWWKPMRVAPTISGMTLSHYSIYNTGTSRSFSAIGISQLSENSGEFYLTTGSLTSGTATHLNTYGDLTMWKADAEL